MGSRQRSFPRSRSVGSRDGRAPADLLGVPVGADRRVQPGRAGGRPRGRRRHRPAVARRPRRPRPRGAGPALLRDHRRRARRGRRVVRRRGPHPRATWWMPPTSTPSAACTASSSPTCARPTRSVVVAALLNPAWKVEIEVEAMLGVSVREPGGQEAEPGPRRRLASSQGSPPAFEALAVAVLLPSSLDEAIDALAPPPRRARAGGRHRPHGRGERRPPPLERRGGARRASTSCAAGATTRRPGTVTLGAGLTYTEMLAAAAGHAAARRWPRRPARSARPRSATPAPSAGTSAPRRPPATRCRCSARSTPSSSSPGPAGRRAVADPRVPHRREAHGARAGRAGRLGHRPRARRLAGLRQGRGPQRHGHRRHQRVPGRRPAGPVRADVLSAPSGPTVLRAREAEAWVAGQIDWAGGAWPAPTRCRRVPGAGGGRGPPDRRPPLHGRLPPPRRRRAGPAAPHRAFPAMSEQYVLHVNGTDARGARRLGRREPPVRAAGAARAARGEGGVRAGRVRLVLGARRRRARVLVPGAGGVGASGARSRRSKASRRPVRPDRRAAGLRRRGWRAVRLLHARADRGRPRPARPRARPDRAGGARGPLGEPVPVHRLRADPRRGGGRRWPAGRWRS